MPIPGSRKLDRLEENIGAINVELTPEDLSTIATAMTQVTLVGNRY